MSGKEVAVQGFPAVDSWGGGQDAPGLAEGLPQPSCWEGGEAGEAGGCLAGTGRLEAGCL